jgi:hypothetical protein
MKKTISFFLAVVLIFLVTGCNDTKQRTVTREANEYKVWTKPVSRGIESINIIMDTSNLCILLE